MSLDVDAPWRLHPDVAMRPEPFGALLYHFGTRRLSIVKDPVLHAVLRRLDGVRTLRSELAEQGCDGARGREVLAALRTLATTEMIVRQT